LSEKKYENCQTEFLRSVVFAPRYQFDGVRRHRLGSLFLLRTAVTIYEPKPQDHACSAMLNNENSITFEAF